MLRGTEEHVTRHTSHVIRHTPHTPHHTSPSPPSQAGYCTVLISRLFPSSAFSLADPSAISNALRSPFITVQKVCQPPEKFARENLRAKCLSGA